MLPAVCYLLVLLLWGAEYNMRLRTNPGIRWAQPVPVDTQIIHYSSDSLRPSGVVWEAHSNIGW